MEKLQAKWDSSNTYIKERKPKDYTEGWQELLKTIFFIGAGTAVRMALNEEENWGISCLQACKKIEEETLALGEDAIGKI